MSQRRRLLLPGKINDQAQASGLASKITPPSGVIEWESNSSTQTADPMLRLASAKAKAERAVDPAEMKYADVWLRDPLKQRPSYARELAKEARADGIAARTLRQAKLRLGILHERIGTRGGFRWYPPGAIPSTPTEKVKVHQSPFPDYPTHPMRWEETPPENQGPFTNWPTGKIPCQRAPQETIAF